MEIIENSFIRIIGDFEGKETILAEYRGSLEGIKNIQLRIIQVKDDGIE